MAGHVFWRVARVIALVIVVALAVQALLARALPSWAASNTGTVVTASLLWGLATALVVEALLRFWRRRSRPESEYRSPS